MYLVPMNGDIPCSILGERPAIKRAFRNTVPVRVAKITLKDHEQSRITRLSCAKEFIVLRPVDTEAFTLVPRGKAVDQAAEGTPPSTSAFGHSDPGIVED